MKFFYISALILVAFFKSLHRGSMKLDRQSIWCVVHRRRSLRPGVLVSDPNVLVDVGFDVFIWYPNANGLEDSANWAVCLA